MEHPARNLLTGTITKYVLLIVNIVTGIFLMPFTMRHLGTAEYGLWMLAASMTAYLQLLDLGYGNGLVRQVTQADARGDEDAVNEILSTFLVVYSALAVLAVAVIGALALVAVPRFPNLSAADVSTARWVLILIGGRLALAFPMSVFGAITTARQRFALTGWIAIAVSVAQAVATYVVLRSGHGLVTMVAVTSAIGVISYIPYAWAAKYTFPGLRLSPFRFSVRQVREVTAFSVYLFLISISIHVGTNADNLIIGAYLGTTSVALYTVALRLADYQRQLCGQFTGLLFPLLVRFHEREDIAALRVTLIDGTRIALALVTGITLCLIAFARPLVEVWMGAGFGASILPLYVLAVLGIVAVAQGPAGTILLAAGRQRLVAFASLVDISANVALSVLLVTRYGLTGVALGTAIPYILLNVGIIMPVASRLAGVPARTFAVAVCVPAIVGSIPPLLLAAYFRWFMSAGSLVAVIAQGAAVGLLYVLTFCAIGLRSADRERYLRSVWRHRIGGARATAALW
jgi:O-antigen/teichoic acid export membrane protein